MAIRPLLEILLNRLERAGSAHAFCLLCYRTSASADTSILSSKAYPKMDEFRGQVSRVHLLFQCGNECHVCGANDPLEVVLFLSYVGYLIKTALIS